jgi:hypothetical protein
LEPSWSRKRQSKRFRVTPFGGPGAASGEALGTLGGAFLGDVVAHRFCIDFLSIFRRFGDGFWYQKSMKKRIENEADFQVFFSCFLRWLCEFSLTTRFIKKWFSYCILQCFVDVQLFLARRFLIDF